MGKNYFRFKQFTIEQDHCANKVSTDACVFGAWLFKELKDKTILDIGCGTGLLSLMLAQNPKNKLRSIELDPNCTEQARENITNSRWNNRIHIEQADIRKWEADQDYDCIVCNPPFFNNTSLSHNPKRNQARQTATLGPSDWLEFLRQREFQTCTIYLLLSNNDVLQDYEKVFSVAGFSYQQKINLLDHAQASCKRVILIASPHSLTSSSKPIIYKNTDGSYTDQFIDLLQEFYLHL